MDPIKIPANVRNGVLFCHINGEEVEIVMPKNWQKQMAASVDDGKADAGADEPREPAKTEAHCRAMFDGAPALRAAFGITTEAPGSDRYERRFRLYAGRAMNRHATAADEAEAQELSFETDCAKRFSETTGAGEPRYRMFGVKTSDPESPEYNAGLAKFIQLERNSRNANRHGILPTTTQVIGSISSSQTIGTLTPPRAATPEELKRAMDGAEQAARERFATDRQCRGNFGVLDNTDPDSPEYQNALARYVARERQWAKDNWKPGK